MMIRRMDASITQRSQVVNNTRSNQTEKIKTEAAVKEKKSKVDSPYMNKQIDKLASKINKTQLYTKDASKIIAENLLKGSVQLYA